MAGPEVRSLVWLSLDSLIINPPLLFNLGVAADAAFRPVHHRNVGSPAREPPDAFWQGIYAVLGVGEMPYTVESFADGQMLRPYFNTHCFAFNPATGLGRAWWARFTALVEDEVFQAGPCRRVAPDISAPGGPQHADRQDPRMERIRLLPPEYNYPLNLLNEMPVNRRPPASTAWSTPCTKTRSMGRNRSR